MFLDNSAGRKVDGNTTAGDKRGVDAAFRKAARLRDAGVVPGQAVLLRAPDGSGYAERLLAVLAVPARPVLVPLDATEAEVRRAAALAGASLVVEAESVRCLRDSAVEHSASAECAVGLLSSGSTGQPKLIWRSEASLRSEGERYRAALDLRPDDHIVLPLPLCHAYGLGWFAAALVSGARVTLLAPRAIGAIVDALEMDAAALVLVPGLARMLVRRHAGEARRLPALRFAMVGAGPVDQALDDAFEAAFGIRLSRNYGSTEMGAVLAGRAPLPPMSVGVPMPGVEVHVADDGALSVRVDGCWHETGDMARWRDGTLTIVGRRSLSARRGARWVAPVEVEQALLAHADIADVRVVRRPGPRHDEDRLLALVVPADKHVGVSDVHAIATVALASHKRPDRVVLRRSLGRNEIGKIPMRAVYSRAAAPISPELLDLALELEQLGVLAALDGEADTAILSAELDLPLESLELTLEAACAGGVVVRHADDGLALLDSLQAQPHDE
jgi:long-chain acyl-CoA synthetase